ncbi:hypothetical protein RDWZM_004418 [Blomia tropicalis]|uniref:Gamma-aminobutyric acid receptor subunit beta n=1 Tax=Blomia tropicalis TaxID=40697 RepID=A0A9Q0MH29_BLOTA|nr:hypothetical protein RDWZM_004418 [Blomia tropicalis]
MWTAMFTVLIAIIPIFSCIEDSALGIKISNLARQLSDETVYNKDIRPNFGDGPVVINITILVNDISSVSEINMDFTIDFYFRQYWHDSRLSFTPIDNVDELTLSGDYARLIWLPDTFIRNSKSLSMHLSTSSSQTNTLIRIKSSGNVLYSTRLTATANCPMDLRYFPGDRQNCKLILASYGYSTKDLQYNWAPGNKSFVLSDLIFLPTFSITGYNQSCTEETLTTGTFTRLICDIFFERSLGYYMYQIYVPGFLIVVISWVPFWLDQEDSHARVGLGVTTVLTMTTLTTSTNASLPKISYIKAIDIYLFMCFLMVFLSLIEYATVGFFETKRQTTKVHSEPIKMEPKIQPIIATNSKDDVSWIDKMSRIIFPTVFILFNIIYVGMFIFIIES